MSKYCKMIVGVILVLALPAASWAQRYPIKPDPVECEYKECIDACIQLALNCMRTLPPGATIEDYLWCDQLGSECADRC